MQSGRFLLAVVLMIATVVLVNVLFPPVAQRREIATDTSAIRAQPAPAPSNATVLPTAPAEAPPAPTTTQPVRADTILVTSPLYRYGISTRGAELVSAEMLRYESFRRPVDPQTGLRQPVQLEAIGTQGLIGHNARVDGRIVDFEQVPFQLVSAGNLRLAEGDSAAVVQLRGTDPQSGQTLDLTYTFRPDDYRIEVLARIQPGGRSVQFMIDMGQTLAVNEANAEEDKRALAYVVNHHRDGIRSVPLSSVRTRTDRSGAQISGERTEEGPLDWVALKNKYFLVAAIPQALSGNAAFGGLVATDVPGRWAVDLMATLPAANNQAAYRLYVGPQEYDRQVALGLEDVNPMGWRWLRPIVRPLGHAFTWILLGTHRKTGLAYGWVLILFGIAVRLALWPLNAKAMRSQMKNMELQPKIKDIQTRYKANPEQMQKEMLKLYREEGFNPMGGCLPLLLPMPVLITLFFVFQSTIEFRGVSFGWLPDLSQADPLYILPVLLGVTMFAQQWLSLRTSPPNPQAQMMLWFMPAFMTIIFLNFASGLNLYYTAQNFASFPQQLQLNRERRDYMASRGIKAPAVTAPSRPPKPKPKT
jgi:YidC/Oxa1 family membrane protein insertase